MKISPRLATMLCVVFATVCLGISLAGFWSLSNVSDAAQRSDARGFAFFWMFLAGIGVVFGVLWWFIHRAEGEDV